MQLFICKWGAVKWLYNVNNSTRHQVHSAFFSTQASNQGGLSVEWREHCISSKDRASRQHLGLRERKWITALFSVKWGNEATFIALFL